jgi:hypothetical protein
MTENQQDDERIESYLRQFRPQQPSPLPGRTKVVLLRWRVPLAACTAAVILLAVAIPFLSRKPVHTSHQSPVYVQQAMPIAQEISLAHLGRAALDDPASLDAQLDSLSTRLLPDVRRSHGILHSLAHE